MSRYKARDLIEELRVLLRKGDEEAFNALLQIVSETYEVSADELLLHL